MIEGVAFRFSAHAQREAIAFRAAFIRRFAGRDVDRFARLQSFARVNDFSVRGKADLREIDGGGEVKDPIGCTDGDRLTVSVGNQHLNLRFVAREDTNGEQNGQTNGNCDDPY